MGLTGREAEVHWQTIGVHNNVNLARKSASRTAHMLLFIARDAGPVLARAPILGLESRLRRDQQRLSGCPLSGAKQT